MSSAAQRFPLTNRNDVWMIEEGVVDLFLVDLQGDETHSSLEYVGTLHAGTALFGVGEIGNGELRTTFLAQVSPSTRLRPLGVGDVDAEQIDGWVEALSGFCAPGLAPLLSRQLSPGNAACGADGEAVTLVGLRSLAWLRGASVALYGDYPSGSAMVPVGRALWAVVAPNAAVVALSTTQWLEEARAEGTAERDLGTLHRALLARRAATRAAEATAERARFQEKIQRDGRVFGSALRKLISPLLPQSATEPMPPSSEALAGYGTALQAVRAAGGLMGIETREPAAHVDGESAGDAVKRIATASNVRYRQVLLRDGWWKSDQGPMIGFTLNGVSAVAYLPKGTSNYVMWDPLKQERKGMTDVLSASLDAHAYVLYRPFPNRKLTLIDILKFGLRNGKRDLITVLGVGVVIGLLGMAMPIATEVLFDEIIPEGQRHNLIQLSVILFSASVAMFLMGLGKSFATQRLEGRMQSEMEAAIWDRLLSMPAGFFRKFTTGDLAMRSLAINQMREVLSGTVVATLLTGVFSIFSFALLFNYSLNLALVAMGLAAVAIAFSALSTWISIRLRRKTLEMDGKIQGRISELLQGVAKFRVTGTEPTAFARWAGDYTWQKKTMLSSAKVGMALSIFNSVFPAATTILIYVMAAGMVRTDPKFTVGSFLAFNAAFGQFLGATLGLTGAVLAVVGIVPLYERAKPILEGLPEMKPELVDPGVLSGSIELAHVGFRYTADGPTVLKDISFTIRAGQYVALVGESGCGKSTIMRLLLGFETPENGSIFYDGRDLGELNMQAVRKQIGVVLQSGKLMAASIHSNIVGESSLSMDVAWEAAQRVGLDDDIRQMPMGMHTVISESGGGLSGGQKQRIMIARAIVHRPRILFFDEATSALDNRTQAIVSESLDSLQSTRIVIAHRLSTILHADQILVFKDGNLHEQGTYTELMEQGGYFADLAKRQLA